PCCWNAAEGVAYSASCRCVSRTLPAAAPDPSPFISADWPSIHHTRIAGPSSRCERLCHMQVAAEADEVARPFQIGGPAAEPGVVAEVVIRRQSLGKLCVLAVINPRVRHNRSDLRTRMRRLVTRRRRDEPTRVGPIARQGWLRGKRWRCCATVATGSGGGRGGSGIGQIFLFAVRGLLSARRDEAGVDARLSRLQQLLMTGWR